MQIDVKSETLIRLADVPEIKWLPKRKDQAVRIPTVYAWAKTGIRGIRLETVVACGSKCTTEAALLRFFERLNAPPEEKPTKARRKKAIDRANDILDNAGI